MNKVMIFTGALLLAGTAGAQTAQTPAADGTAATATATTATTGQAPQVTVGSAVVDTAGGAVGTISAVSGGNATIDLGDAKAMVPTTSFAKGPSGLVIAMTKPQLEAAVAAQTKPVEVAVGNTVVGPQGATVGKVTAVAGDLVTLQTNKTKVQLPLKAFAQKGPGTLVIGLTPEQLDAAAKAAAPGGS